MYARQQSRQDNIYEIFSDMSLLMLAAFVFLFAMILINVRLQSGQGEHDAVDTLQQQLASIQASYGVLEQESMKSMTHLQKQLEEIRQENGKLKQEASHLIMDQSEQILAAAGMGRGLGRKDFELFVGGLKNIPGNELHLVVDATGSMHGVTSFLIPVLRVIAMRSGKTVTALSWYADQKTGTFEGGMSQMFDSLMQDAPFVGSNETVGHAFVDIAKNAPVPSAYLLIGDEPPSDDVYYQDIPAPVFTLPLGVDNDSSLRLAYQELAEKTGGKTLVLKFK